MYILKNRYGGVGLSYWLFLFLADSVWGLPVWLFWVLVTLFSFASIVGIIMLSKVKIIDLKEIYNSTHKGKN